MNSELAGWILQKAYWLRKYNVPEKNWRKLIAQDFRENPYMSGRFTTEHFVNCIKMLVDIALLPRRVK